jgi:hypothetical protein
VRFRFGTITFINGVMRTLNPARLHLDRARESRRRSGRLDEVRNRRLEAGKVSSIDDPRPELGLECSERSVVFPWKGLNLTEIMRPISGSDDVSAGTLAMSTCQVVRCAGRRHTRTRRPPIARSLRSHST